jgi:hypothetical protein
MSTSKEIIQPQKNSKINLNKHARSNSPECLQSNSLKSKQPNSVSHENFQKNDKIMEKICPQTVKENLNKSEVIKKIENSNDFRLNENNRTISDDVEKFNNDNFKVNDFNEVED